jgi:lipopolysaccharide/colanic/teichoic acid biosynthesis glycosyltransferase
MSMHLGSALPSERNRAFLRPSAAGPARSWLADAPRWAARAGCGVLLLAALPVMVPAAAAVLATSAGPTLTRLGRISPDGRVVFLRQFRTTYRHEIGHGAPSRFRRTTPVGWVLRQSGIARLPMLLDVWQGKIGLVAALRA